jgi:hypothetical protein
LGGAIAHATVLRWASHRGTDESPPPKGHRAPRSFRRPRRRRRTGDKSPAA